MFSATKFVVAGAIVALFGGFLLSGILTQPSKEPLPPAAASASSSPEADTSEQSVRSDLLPGVDLVTEEVEPGVFQVLSDAVGHDFDSISPAWLTIGQDGSVVVFEGDGSTTVTGHFTLGREGSHEFDERDRSQTWFFDAALAADGALWAILDAGWGAQNRMSVFDGSSWKTLERPAGSGLAGVEIGPEGTVWASRTAQDGRGPRVGRLLDGEWSRLPESDDPALRSYYGGGPFHVGPGGTLWFANGGIGPIRQDFRGLLRFDGEDWHAVVPDEERAGAFVNALAVGPDGTVWVYLVPGDAGDAPRLARLGADGWDVFTEQDGVPLLHLYGNAGPDLAVDDSGTLWIAINGRGVSFDEPGSDVVHGCPGVLSFDGNTWTGFLAGHCVNHIEVGPGGSIWGSAPYSEEPSPNTDEHALPSPGSLPGGVYVITPEAMAAAE